MKITCEMMGCKKPVYKALSIAPGTFVQLCKEHYDEEVSSSPHFFSNFSLF